MPYRPPKKQPEFADLKGILAQGKDTDNAIYQTVQEIIERLTQFKGVIVEEGKAQQVVIDGILKNIASKFATYLTAADESSILPNSRQLLAGTGITFDDTVPNKRTINSSGGDGSYYDAPLTDGDEEEGQLIFADGECIICQVPNVP